MDGTDRSEQHAAVAAALAGLTDDGLQRLLASARTRAGGGIGGGTAVLEVAGVPVFVKRLAVTDQEQQAGPGSTADLFGLPLSCHYGVGAPSSSAWRELRLHEVTTQWVLDGSCEAFPLLHHWRLLPQRPRRPLDCAEHGDLDTWVDFWHGSDAVRRRLQAVQDASIDLVLLLEHVPQDLLSWLADRHAEGALSADAALARVEPELVRIAQCLAAGGLLHFDAHLRNVLVDDDRLYLTDFGLAVSTSFSLRTGEAAFLAEHREHDLAYVLTELVNWVVTHLTDASRAWTSPAQRNDFVRRCAAGHHPAELLPAAAGVVRRWAPVATVVNAFYFELYGSSRGASYPGDALRAACAAGGISVGGPAA